jgi:hypothetical protein
MNFIRLTTLWALTWAGSALAAEPCDAPGARDLKPLQAAIASDEAVGAAFEATALACPPVPAEGCDAQKLKCGESLTQNLKKMVGFDEGAWVRDMLLPYLGQSYKPTVVLPTVVTPATDVSCTADHLTLRAAALRRKQQADRRKLVAGEYAKWQVWAMAVRQTCVDKVKAQKEQEDVGKAEAARLAAAAAALKTAEEARQAELKTADEARQAELKRQAQALEDAKKAEEKRKQEAEREQARKQAEAEAKARAAANAQVVADREAKKHAQEQRVDDLKAKEELRRQEAEDQLKAAKLASEAEHQKKIDALKKDLALNEEQKAKAVAEEEKRFGVQEETRRRNAEAEIAKASKIDRSDERLRGNLALHAVGGISLLNGAPGAALGAHFRGRFGFWGLAPADGMASGAEIKLFSTLIGMPGTAPSLFQFEGGGEVRAWYRRVSLGVSASYDYLGTTLASDDGTGTQVAVPCPSVPGSATPCAGASSFALGPSVNFAIVDNPTHQFLIGVRWIPTFQGDLLRFASEFEIAFEWFTLTLQAGLKQDSHAVDAVGATVPRLGFWAVAGLGGRFRW